MEDTTTPLHVQIVAKLTFKYGSSDSERQHSHVFVRINAFASRACLGKSFEALTLGMPAKGLIDGTDGDYKSAQLIGFLDVITLPPPPTPQLSGLGAQTPFLSIFETISPQNIPNKRDYNSFWSTTSYTEWYHAQPSSYWADGIELDPEAIFYLPQLADANIQKLYKPQYRLLAQPGKLKLIAAEAFAPHSEGVGGILGFIISPN